MSDDSSPLTSCIAKLLRANAHLRALEESIQGFIDDHPYRVEAELDSDEHPNEVIFYGRVVRNPSDAEIVRWGVMIGDVAHTLRSALDHLIWTLTISRNPRPPEPLAGKWRRVSFPVIIKWDDRGRALFDEALWGVGDEVRALIEGLQPATRRKDDPERDPLALLQELWNIDKHRTIHTVKMFVGISNVEQREPFPGGPNLNFDVVWKAALGPFEDNTPLARVAPRTDGEIIASSAPHMNMYPRVVFDIAFDEGPPAYGGRMLETLKAIASDVGDIVWLLGRYVVVSE